jgi:ketosteroid isomerase-like protein
MGTRTTVFLILTSFLLFSCHAGDDGQAKKEELKNIVLDYYNALSRQDLQKANSLTTGNFMFFDEGLILNNRVAIDSVKKMGRFTATFTIDSLNVHVDKKDASAYYFRTADFAFANGQKISVRFLESVTFNKEGNKWKLRFMHSSVRK